MARISLWAGAVLFGVCSLAGGQMPPPDWPGYLGPTRDGLSTETINTDWRGKPPALRYRVPLGEGLSSLCVVGNRLYTQTIRGAREVVIAFDADTGRELWTCDGADIYLDQQGQAPGPRATPTHVDGQLYCLFPAGNLLCVQAESGQVVWRINILDAAQAENRSGETFYWGLSQSPLVSGDTVVVCPGGSRNNSVLAVDRRTGRTLWMGGSDPPGYGSPIECTLGGQRHIVCVSGLSLLAFDPAGGRPLWRVPIGNKYHCNCATPLVVDERIFYSAAYGTGATLIEIRTPGSSGTPAPVWVNLALQNQMSTSIVLDGSIYGSSGDLGATTLRCLDLKTGNVRWIERGPGKCTMISAAGHLICLSDNGTLRLIEANPARYVEKGRFDQALAAPAWTPPALARGKLYLRDRRELFCLDVSAP